MRAILAAGLLFFAATASSAMACTIIENPKDRPPEGLNDAQLRAFYDRQFYLNDLTIQRADWQDADQIFLVEVRALRVSGENRVAAVLKPIVAVKGHAFTRSLNDNYAPNYGAMCGETNYPAIGEWAIAYTRRLPWWRSVLNWGRPEIMSVRSLRFVVDKQVPAELRAAASRLRKVQS